MPPRGIPPVREQLGRALAMMSPARPFLFPRQTQLAGSRFRQRAIVRGNTRTGSVCLVRAMLTHGRETCQGEDPPPFNNKGPIIMGRPRKIHGGEYNDDEQTLRNTCDGAELRSFIERIEEVNANIKEYSDDRREIFKEFKQKGYDPKTLRAIIKRHAMDPEERDAADALLEMYQAALGDFADTPLGVAGAARVREDAAAG